MPFTFLIWFVLHDFVIMFRDFKNRNLVTTEKKTFALRIPFSSIKILPKDIILHAAI